MEFLSVLGVAFLVGIVVGMTGMGGGALMTPALLFLGVHPTVAVANDLVAAAINKSVGAAVHWRQGTPNLRLVCWLALGSVPSAFAGAFIIQAVGPSEQQQEFVKLAIGVALLLAAGTYVLRIFLTSMRPRGATHHDNPPIKPIQTMLAGAVGGVLVGLTSVGAGSVIMVVLLLLYPGLVAARLVGTDLLQAVPLVIAAAIGHIVTSGVTWSILVPLVLGGMPGTYVGSKLAARVHQKVVRRGIIIVLTLTGLTLLGTPPLAVGCLGIGLVLFGTRGVNTLRRSLMARRSIELPAEEI